MPSKEEERWSQMGEEVGKWVRKCYGGWSTQGCKFCVRHRRICVQGTVTLPDGNVYTCWVEFICEAILSISFTALFDKDPEQRRCIRAFYEIHEIHGYPHVIKIVESQKIPLVPYQGRGQDKGTRFLPATAEDVKMNKGIVNLDISKFFEAFKKKFSDPDYIYGVEPRAHVEI